MSLGQYVWFKLLLQSYAYMRDKIILLFTIFYAQTIAHDNDIKIKRGGQATNIQNIIYNFVRNYEGLCMPVRLMT